MGVKGLKSYIEGKNLYLKDCHFKGSKLIIDGCNLCNVLYEASKNDLKHGGDYIVYEILIRKFFAALKNCNIEPYVILDGGSDHTDKKLETHKDRARQRIKEGKYLSLGRQYYGSGPKPTLLAIVFSQILTLLKVPFVQCMEEADWEIAALANQWNCPVLSDDSDFFIFELKAGVLPISHFEWRKVSAQKFIPAKRFLVSNFCKSLHNLSEQFLPLFAALAGNDYINVTRHTIRWEEFSSCNARLDGILHWLSDFPNTKGAIGAFLDCLEDQKSRGQVRKALMACLKEYELTKSNVAQFFLKAVVPSKLPVELQVLPNWMRMPLSKGRLSSTLIDALVLQRVRLSAQVENFELPSSNAVSRPIRQVLYGLLLSDQKQRDDRKPIARVNPGECYVEEYDREGLTLTTFWVKAACPVSGKDLHLKTLNKAPWKLRLQVLYDTLGVSKLISTPNAKFQLPVYVTCYWLSKADPRPCLEDLWALLLGFVFGELNGRYKGETGIALVWNRLNNLRSHTTPGGPDLMAAHTYSQWQACMRDTYKLNQLLCLPLAELWPHPELARLYCGPLVHQAAARLRGGATPESFLSGGPIPLQLFRDLERAVLDSLDDDIRDQLQRGPQQHHPRRRAQTIGNLDELTRQFDQMFDEDEDEDDEDNGGRRGKAKSEDDEAYVQIRTRHKKKSRALRACSPGKLNKRDRVIWA
ncbi:hypothetical protein AALO_G00177460 [Alosa alosa]|uniref:Asteroid domain-containing protein n=1 Tax=Alosa alosa TaxID=278164 RepID=A0AAV6G9J1_9TELE|nr:protein asteroid homolog 1-like [Alosa alosa]KAG5271239.1 hypothetical protein AALO_G00177460 [Alosa alosa]